ncbi:unnamed protein product [Arabidopsis thaliana]|uniref:F-box domain-containing protein n=2 Tax=Arabidopsis TaxID=3701 RepID=A0A178W397_ARATH|nr:F-box associated interaction domain [Arabidopsis thaliana x Arabidopsis arenosa]OAP12616.1 hypothetical protein AXX17_AT1G71340 [Arabidopsis thaliana]CAA0338568.1 unnamed protein product [Arabidopsis thaliana]VYS51254.1 unnamed protein product [Arabidopsis thaliana]
MEGITSFENLPEELKREILLRMSPNSLVTCSRVSKKLASMIRTKSFKELYLSRSMRCPRVLFAANGTITPHVLFTSFQEKEKPLLSSGEQRIITSLQGEFLFSPPVRGLICLVERESARIVICNPGTTKFLALPIVEADETTRIITHLGYDEQKDVFKVLCTRTKPETPHLVLTVGSGKEPWREIEYANFRTQSETFMPITSPHGVDLNKGSWRLVNYSQQGGFALVNESRGFIYQSNGGDAYLETWVWNVDTRKWSMNSILIRKWKDYAQDNEDYDYRFRGTQGTYELVFAPIRVKEDGSLTVILYNTDTQAFRRSKVQMMGEGHEFRFVDTFLDHVDSTLLI